MMPLGSKWSRRSIFPPPSTPAHCPDLSLCHPLGMTSRPGCTCNPRVPGSAVVHPLGIPRRHSSGIVLGGIPPPTASHERGGLENDALPRRMRAFEPRDDRRAGVSTVVALPPLRRHAASHPPPPGRRGVRRRGPTCPPRGAPNAAFVSFRPTTDPPPPILRSGDSPSRARGADLSSIFVNSHSQLYSSTTISRRARHRRIA